MSELRCLLWDVDGTLADTEKDGHRVAFNLSFENAGLERRWDVKTYGELLAVTGGKERIRFDIERGAMPEMSADSIAKLHANKTQFYQKLIADGLMPLRPGVKRLLQAAYDAKLTLGIATTTTPAALDALITHSLGSEWFDRFAILAAGDIVPNKKPAPDIYEYALSELKMEAKHTLALEDSENGLKSAKAAGLKCIITVNEYTQDHDFSNADLVISDFGEPNENTRQVLTNKHQLNNLEFIQLDHLKQLIDQD